MSNEALVSIIIPIYGTEQFLPKCIDSVLAQTYSQLEIILVDDESPDACPKICDSYMEKDDRIVVIHEENKGVSGARNTGLKRAKGDYIMFVDSDDELYPDAVKIMIEDTEKHDADIVSALKEIVHADGRTHSDINDDKVKVYHGDEALILSLDGDRNTNSACAKLFNRSFIDGLFFDEGRNINEDGFFVFQCYVRKPVLVQHDTLVYRYNFREGSGSKQKFSKKHLAMLYFCEQKKQLIAEQFPQYTDKAHNMEVRTCLQFLDLLCRTTDKKYNSLKSSCIKTVRRFYRCHRPINKHHRQLALIVKYGFYPVYRQAFRLKYYR